MIPDVPVNVLFLVLFTIAYAGHAVTFRRNVAMGKKFLLSAMVFGESRWIVSLAMCINNELKDFA